MVHATFVATCLAIQTLIIDAVLLFLINRLLPYGTGFGLLQNDHKKIMLLKI
jgi:hypothetical protein